MSSDCPHERIVIEKTTIRTQESPRHRPEYRTLRYRCASCKTPLTDSQVFKHDTDVLMRVN